MVFLNNQSTLWIGKLSCYNILYNKQGWDDNRTNCIIVLGTKRHKGKSTRYNNITNLISLSLFIILFALLWIEREVYMRNNFIGRNNL